MKPNIYSQSFCVQEIKLFSCIKFNYRHHKNGAVTKKHQVTNAVTNISKQKKWEEKCILSGTNCDDTCVDGTWYYGKNNGRNSKSVFAGGSCHAQETFRGEFCHTQCLSICKCI